MKRSILTIIIALLFSSSPARAAITSVGGLGTANSTSDSLTLVITTSAQLDAGNIGVCLASKDNDVATGDAETSEFASVTDSGSNTWTKIKEFSNGEGLESAGVIGAIFWTKATSNVASGGTITGTLSSNTSCQGYDLLGVCGCWWEHAASSRNSATERIGHSGRTGSSNFWSCE